MIPTCDKCHFLAKEHRNEAGQVHKFSLSNGEREKLRVDAGTAIQELYSLNCNYGVWDEGITGKQDRKAIIIEEKRGNCFFYPHTPGMMFDAARELQKRQQEAAAIRRSNKYTRIGLWIAVAALCVNALISFIRLKYG